MVSLLEAAKDSEKTFRESLLFMAERPEIVELVQGRLDKYKDDRNSIYKHIRKSPRLHMNPVLTHTKGSANGNLYTFEAKQDEYLSISKIQEFYDTGFIAEKYRFKHLNNAEIQKIQDEFVIYKNRCQSGMYGSPYNKLPDYAGHLYLSNVVKLLKDNYDMLVKKSMSLFNVPEEQLFFAVGVFLIDESGKGINVHQDYAYHILGHTSEQLTTSLITYHLSICDNSKSHLYLFPRTHKEILHNLTTLKYIHDNKIDIDEKLSMWSGCITDYLIEKAVLPYEGGDTEVLKLSHISRYPQQLYILSKYKGNDIKGYEVNTSPGEYMIFDPAILHANGASSGNINELIQSLEGQISKKDIFRMSLAIRVMHTTDERGHFLWMCAPEKIDVIQKFVDERYKEYKPETASKGNKVHVKKTGKEFFTVLSNNKLSSPDSPYFSVEEIYDLHKQTGAYDM